MIPSRRALPVLLALAVSTACLHREEGGESVALTPFATSPAPLSHNKHVALIAKDTACVIESFDFRIACTTSKGAAVGSFGGEGEGPGEFLNPVHVFRESRGRVAVFDRRLGRLSTFHPDGAPLVELALRRPFWVHGTRNGTVYGEVGLGMGPNGPEVEIQMLDAASGDIEWRRSIYRIAETACASMGSGRPRPDGGYVFWACENEIVFLDDLDGDDARIVRSPTYTAELPNQRDIDAYLMDMARLGGTMALPQSAMEPYAAAFREQPKKWFHGSGTFSYDVRGRLWVATTRDHDTFSYFEVWVGAEYAGSVRIRDRLMGYDILDSTLVALVERKPDSNGIARRAIDWYDIGGVAFGHQDG